MFFLFIVFALKWLLSFYPVRMIFNTCITGLIFSKIRSSSSKASRRISYLANWMSNSQARKELMPGAYVVNTTTSSLKK